MIATGFSAPSAGSQGAITLISRAALSPPTIAVGSAIFGFDVIGPVGVAFAFGFVLLALAYAIGPVSGCHVNPAVTLGVLIAKGITLTEAGIYWAAQFLGGILGAALLKAVVSIGDVTDNTGGFGTNNWGEDAGLGVHPRAAGRPAVGRGSDH